MTTTGPDRETLRAAIALATCAPSVHNTQPWRWSIGAGETFLFADRTRQVPVTDPDGRDLLISCGAVLHHLRVVLAARGWWTDVHRLPDHTAPDHLATLTFRPHLPADREIALSAAITRRHTDRRRMSSHPVSADHLELVAGLAEREGALCAPITDPGARFHLAGAIAQAAVVQAGDPRYVAEMVQWSGRGSGAAEGVPSANIPHRSGNSPGDPGMRVFPHGTLTQPTGKSYGQRTEYLVIATSGDDPLSRLRAGEATSAALLGATDLGLATCPLSQPLELADARRVVRDDVLGGSAEPQLIIRLGWAPTNAERLPGTPRRVVDDVIDYPDLSSSQG